MDTMPSSVDVITTDIRSRALSAGFSTVGFTAPSLTKTQQDNLHRYLRRGNHGTMHWMDTPLRYDPKSLLSSAQTAIVLGYAYGSPSSSLAPIARYAVLSEDYHLFLRRKLNAFVADLMTTYPAEYRACVDSAPIMEKALAENAGIGWQGKHTCVISKQFSAWQFLAVILTSLPLAYDTPHRSLCGSCTRCLDACPTQALSAEGIDSRRCLSYLTIEHKGHLDTATASSMGTQVFGCDICLTACPWHRKTPESGQALAPYHGFDLKDFLSLTPATFATHFKDTPIKRRKYHPFMVRVLIAAGNSGRSSLIPFIKPHYQDILLADYARSAVDCLKETLS